MNYNWENCPAELKSLLGEIVEKHREILGDNLTGFYLHGSLAMGCFNPALSDLDFLVVVRNEIPAARKRALVRYMIGLGDRVPDKGIEMSVVLERYARNFVYPTPFELHYSNGWRERFINNEVDFTEQKTDEDLAAHFVVVLERGIRLYGKPAAEVFTDTANVKKAFSRSLLFDAGQIFNEYKENPLYTVLNLSRNLAYLREGKVLSKLEGADWALCNLPADLSPLVASARNRYLGEDEMEIDAGLLDDFTTFMKREIEDISVTLD